MTQLLGSFLCRNDRRSLRGKDPKIVQGLRKMSCIMGNATWYNYITLVSKRNRVDHKNQTHSRASFFYNANFFLFKIPLHFLFKSQHGFFCSKWRFVTKGPGTILAWYTSRLKTRPIFPHFSRSWDVALLNWGQGTWHQGNSHRVK